ncbi:hypothetical protein SCP_0509240 [Sparassis crispa]|uniref:Uncharacterized protein n=1 Tax=Sparassis crispa TaxID=139825 RepID=A0A401GNR2_9APHY|nr:hypothetical protein SCP_0509240 [Sparassis crispa]GBE83867.1 hypothetical protein SCP_0509240 [Sparassis crispa]
MYASDVHSEPIFNGLSFQCILAAAAALEAPALPQVDRVADRGDEDGWVVDSLRSRQPRCSQKVVESDPFYNNGVWDKEKPLIFSSVHVGSP